jgi:hypothetical protein
MSRPKAISLLNEGFEILDAVGVASLSLIIRLVGFGFFGGGGGK